MMLLKYAFFAWELGRLRCFLLNSAFAYVFPDYLNAFSFQGGGVVVWFADIVIVPWLSVMYCDQPGLFRGMIFNNAPDDSIIMIRKPVHSCIETVFF